MAMFYVQFSYDNNRRKVGKPMCGANRRCVAREIRERYPDAHIDAISAVDGKRHPRVYRSRVIA